MKKAVLLLAVAVLFASAFVHIRLVAKETQTTPQTTLKTTPDTAPVVAGTPDAEPEKTNKAETTDGTPPSPALLPSPSSAPSGNASNEIDPDYRALLEKRVEIARVKYDMFKAMSQAGHPKGTAIAYMSAELALRSAEIGLYRYTGEKEKLLAAAEGKVNVAQQALQGVKAGFESGSMGYPDLGEAELALAEAEYELKTVVSSRASSKASSRATYRPFVRSTWESTVLPDSAVSSDSAAPPLRYQGKTFDEWAEELRTELDPSIHTKIITALGVFGDNGYGRQAAEIVLGTVKPYDINQKTSPHMKSMLQTAVFIFTADRMVTIPITDSFPLLIRNLLEGDANERAFALRVFDQFNPKLKAILPEIVETLRRMDITDANETQAKTLARCLGGLDPEGGATLEFLREAIKNNDAKRFSLMFDLAGENPLAGQKPLSVRGVVSGGVAYGDQLIELSDFGERLLEFLRKEGVASSEETIRMISGKVIEKLEAIKAEAQTKKREYSIAH